MVFDQAFLVFILLFIILSTINSILACWCFCHIFFKWQLVEAHRTNTCWLRQTLFLIEIRWSLCEIVLQRRFCHGRRSQILATCRAFLSLPLLPKVQVTQSLCTVIHFFSFQFILQSKYFPALRSVGSCARVSEFSGLRMNYSYSHLHFCRKIGWKIWLWNYRMFFRTGCPTPNSWRLEIFIIIAEVTCPSECIIPSEYHSHEIHPWEEWKQFEEKVTSSVYQKPWFFSEIGEC